MKSTHYEPYPNKIKVIDLLNKIANGEEIKAKLKFKLGDIIITYYGMDNYYHTPEYDIEYIDKGCTTHDFTLGMLIKCLNNEIEIIEEEKKIPEKVDRAKCVDFADTLEKTLDTLDKLIDYLNKENK